MEVKEGRYFFLRERCRRTRVQQIHSLLLLHSENNVTKRIRGSYSRSRWWWWSPADGHSRVVSLFSFSCFLFDFFFWVHRFLSCSSPPSKKLTALHFLLAALKETNEIRRGIRKNPPKWWIEIIVCVCVYGAERWRWWWWRSSSSSFFLLHSLLVL